MKKLGMLLRVSCSLNNHQVIRHFIYLLSKKQKENLNKIPTNKPLKIFY